MPVSLRRLPASLTLPFALILTIVATLFAAFPAHADVAALPAFRSEASAADRATPAGAAVYALTGSTPTDALRFIPRDFAVGAHYTPILRDGVPAKPTGGCSDKGVPFPETFMPICAAHDLGFDLLRYAAHTGHPLGPWARKALDAMLIKRMYAECRDSLCRTAAQSANVGLKFNTWRQFYGVPMYETPADVGASLVGRSVDLVRAAAAGGSSYRAVVMLVALVLGFIAVATGGRAASMVRRRLPDRLRGRRLTLAPLRLQIPVRRRRALR
ncbi:hypothetical protein [Tsukamurella soli]|uniref:Phospholipase A2 n=1 Tax=Tsukamurella soli TaxID=644556 RepID=A0ABP8JTG7_9ACTN